MDPERVSVFLLHESQTATELADYVALHFTDLYPVLKSALCEYVIKSYRCRAICYGPNRVVAYDDAEVVGLAYLAESKPVVDYRFGQKEVRMLDSEEEVIAFRKDWERECSACRLRQTGVSR